MRVLPVARPWRKLFLVALGLFLLTRLVTLTSFPIFNDEAIYLQYAQQIHDDWAQNKFVSMDNPYGDWKPPLQYWLAAPVIGWGNDPLVAGRAVALVVSLIGLFGFYLFTRELLGEREASIASILYVLCPPVLFHNDEFIAETFLFSIAPLVYWAILKMMRAGRWRVPWTVGAMLGALALLLFKQSGFLLLGVSILLPITSWRPNETNWKQLTLNFLLVTTVIVAAQVLANAILPHEFDATKKQFNSNWVMSVHELMALPTSVWRANFQRVTDYIGAYYSWFTMLFFIIGIWFAMRRKNFVEMALILMCLAGAIGVTVLLRGFNEYLFNTAIIAALLPLLARVGVVIWESKRTGNVRLVRAGLLASAALMFCYWSYQVVLIWSSPGKFIEQTTPWAAANYLTGWPTGFGVKQVVALLEKEKQPGIIFADAQWGNPRTALEVYQARFPNLRIIPISREFSDAATVRKFAELAKKNRPVHFAIFSADPFGRRRDWQANVEHEMCVERTEVSAYPGQMPIVVCRF